MRTLKILSLVIAGAIVTVACGDSKSSMNPVAPSAIVVGTQSDEAGAGDAVSTVTAGPKNGNGNGNNGGGNGNGNDKDKDKGKDQPTAPTVPGNVTPPSNTTPSVTTHKVEIEGVITAKAGDSITVNGQTIVVPATCTIRHGQTSFTFSQLQVGDRVHVRAQRTTTGSGATSTTTLQATEVMLQNPSGSGDDDDDPVDPTALVSASAFDALASETGANSGAFRLTRSGSATMLASPLTVTFTLTGTATNGTDYSNVPLTATFLANQASVDVLVTPVVDTATEGSETVVLTLTAVTPYDLGSPATATVTITDTDTPLVSVTAFDSTASETGADFGTIRFSRTGPTTASLTVTFTVTGTATNGTDYQTLPLTVTFAAGQPTTDLFVMPFADAASEGSETVIVTITDGASYDLGSAATATVSIAG